MFTYTRDCGNTNAMVSLLIDGQEIVRKETISRQGLEIIPKRPWSAAPKKGDIPVVSCEVYTEEEAAEYVPPERKKGIMKAIRARKAKKLNRIEKLVSKIADRICCLALLIRRAEEEEVNEIIKQRWLKDLNRLANQL